MSTMDSRVLAGIAWLDEKKPSWRDLIDWEKLDMINARHCIAGQVFAEEGKGMYSACGCCETGYNYACQLVDPVEMAFEPDMGETYEDLEDTWRTLA